MNRRNLFGLFAAPLALTLPKIAKASLETENPIAVTGTDELVDAETWLEIGPGERVVRRGWNPYSVVLANVEGNPRRGMIIHGGRPYSWARVGSGDFPSILVRAFGGTETDALNHAWRVLRNPSLAPLGYSFRRQVNGVIPVIEI